MRSWEWHPLGDVWPSKVGANVHYPLFFLREAMGQQILFLRVYFFIGNNRHTAPGPAESYWDETLSKKVLGCILVFKLPGNGFIVMRIQRLCVYEYRVRYWSVCRDVYLILF
ncbi:uncharacterized protein TM35_000801030 [Trypanosoma theileri]|uniref:Uncharacterized protein n=1 Tax=Trypanosoma theileri TaxID=67003 RepID=A0A1X0NEY1_9TRYP|nr:uncharacterized protein TM35_000801030 [Trypanosoma theileri]ORC82965.1 hypothetical protein TM35_000801030 [Trypanosoma theileri]